MKTDLTKDQHVRTQKKGVSPYEVISSQTNGQVTDTSLDNRFMTRYAEGVNVSALESELKKRISGEVRFDAGSKALYATDSSNYRQVPLGVVLPRTEQDVINTISTCRKYGAPVTSRGGGTSLAGQTCNVAVIMDMAKYYNRILNIDKENRRVTVQPGIVLDHMREATTKHAGLTFGPDPSTHNHCTIGGMLGNNSCGVHSVMAAHAGYGARMSDNLDSMIVMTYDGIKMEVGATTDEQYQQILKEGGRKAEIYKKLKAFIQKYEKQVRERFPMIPRRVSGYNLPDLLPENGFNVARGLVGSEGTLITILEAKLKLLHNPPSRSLVVLGYPDLYHCGKDVMRIMSYKPIGLEGLDDLLIYYMKKKGLHVEDLSLLPSGKAWLLAEFGGSSKEEADQKAQKMMDEINAAGNPPEMSLFDDPHQEHLIWLIRESGLGATAWVPGEPITHEGWEDSAVPPENIGEYLVELRKLFSKFGYNPSLYGHFGQGCVHCRVAFDLLTKEGLENYKNFTIEAARLVVQYGGSVSGEHGDGQSKADLLEIMYGKELVQAFREFKEIWDPEWKMNPGKIVEPFGQLSNLREGPHFSPQEPETMFQFPDSQNSFSRASMRCVGVGECRRDKAGTMCPSYRVTHEEKHSTRGRARMLFEMLQGDVIKGWKSKEVKDSLDLCLACKGCKGDCPVNVDMATYKSEFLYHYYKGRLRPRTAYAFGLIYWWSRLAALMPDLANFITGAPIVSSILKFIAGIAPQRKIPAFARQTFREWFIARKEKTNSQKPKVILWTDTFNNYYLSETLIAGMEVLEAAGFEVVIPRQTLCCGRPLYDFGMLELAKKQLKQIMSSLRTEIQNGIPIVGLEPSCVAVFRDELINLFPENMDAMRLQKQTFTLAEFLDRKAPDFKIPKLDKKILFHGHCHHKAVMGVSAEDKLLKKMDAEYKMLDSGCCGMAGYFGYEKGNHYDVSQQVGELVLLPAIRQAEKETVIVTDGFSCREQIAMNTQRKGLHFAQLLQMALHQEEKICNKAFPEREYLKRQKPGPGRNAVISNLAAGLALGLAGVYLLSKAFHHLKTKP